MNHSLDGTALHAACENERLSIDIVSKLIEVGGPELLMDKNEDEDNIIDNHLWLILRFMPKKCAKVQLYDVVRFGRIPFKVTTLVLDVDKHNKSIRDEN